MNRLSRRLTLGLLAMASLAAANDDSMLIAGWPQGSHRCAGVLMTRYGSPDSAASGTLVWLEKGDGLTITVHRFENSARQSGVVEQAVRFRVPEERRADITRLGLGVSYAGGVLTANSQSSEAGILALNVAADVAGGVRSVEDAREFHRRALDLPPSAYTRGLRFKPAPRPRSA